MFHPQGTLPSVILKFGKFNKFVFFLATAYIFCLISRSRVFVKMVYGRSVLSLQAEDSTYI
jgi:hypothetical protein